MALCVWSLAGCSHVTISHLPTASTEFATQAKTHAFLWGIIKARPLRAEVVCPNHSVKLIHYYSNWSDVTLTGLTLGIYLPQRAEVQCAKPKALPIYP